MLVIENINKVHRQTIIVNGDLWEIKYLPNGNVLFYEFQIKRLQFPKGYSLSCEIWLDREGKRESVEENPDMVYYFWYNAKQINVCATTGWLADKDNFCRQIGEIVKEYLYKK